MATSDSLLKLKFTTMNKDLLLPYGFKRIGWGVLSIALALGIWAAAIDFDYSKVEYLQCLQLQDQLINNYIVIGLWIGALFVGCSHERVEDEMIGRVRLNALLIALYTQAIFIIFTTLTFNSLDYLNIMIYNLVTYPIIFVIVYRLMLWRINRSMNDGE